MRPVSIVTRFITPIGIVLLVGLAGLTGLLCPAAAQETTGKLEGRILDPAGNPVPYVNVSVTGPALQGMRGAMSMRDGTFTILSLPVGRYTVRLSHIAFKERNVADVPVRLDQTASTGDLRMEPTVLGQKEIAVVAKAPLIDPASSTVGGDLEARKFVTLPLDRDYRSMTALLPQANPSSNGDPVNFAGSTGFENRYFVDGIDVTEPIRGTLGTALPYNFVQEVEVRTGGYQAEYRSSMGGTLNAVTYSGSNRFGGQVFGYFMNNGLKAAPKALANDDRTRGWMNYDAGFGVGGPLRVDKLWYYAAYNPVRETMEVEVPGQGWHQDRMTRQSFASKLTWRASGTNTIVFSALGDPTNRRLVLGRSAWLSSVGTGGLSTLANVDPALRDVHSGGTNVALEGRHILRDNLVVKSLVSWARSVDREEPATERGKSEYLYNDAVAGTVSGGGSTRNHRSDVIVAGLNGTLLRGDHQWKAGVEYKDNRCFVRYTGTTVTLFARDDYGLDTAVQNEHLAVRTPAAFLQDSWRFTDQIRLNAGVRWEGMYIVGGNGRVAQSILDEWQPRLGFTFDPGRTGRQKISGSYGRFYQELPVYPLTWAYNGRGMWVWAAYDHDPRGNPAGGDSTVASTTIQPKVKGMNGQFTDEYTLGYERQVGEATRLGVRGIYRHLGEALEDGFDPETGEYHFGNPGSGLLSEFPKARRTYNGLELSYQGEIGTRANVLASYVLSRSYGNYTGAYNSDMPSIGTPNAGESFDLLAMVPNNTGLLPNDRPHVLKVSGTWQASPVLLLGMAGSWMSGTPLSDWGQIPDWNGWQMYLRPRGTAGRTPSIWDLNFRIGYVLPTSIGSCRPKLNVDLLHVAGQRKPVLYDQWHYLSASTDDAGNIIQGEVNPNYLKPIAYQPPMAVRMGMEVGF